jgi:hypothetical protein
MEMLMKRILLAIQAVLLVVGLLAGQPARADSDLQMSAGIALQTNDVLFTPEDLDDLLAPIALYPDPLLAQILPAATFIDQIDEAARYVGQYGQSASIDYQPWDVSVRAIAHYPDVLFMMDQKYDWTVSLGQAFVNQQQDVMDAVQRLRAEANAVGNLVSTPQQQVYVEPGYISIIPAAPEMIYVPVYDPFAVYFERPSPGFGFITFGIGFTIGAWLNRDCDWRGHRVYYHGWQGGGWIARARPHVQVRNNVYINNSYRTININRTVVRHDTLRYREQVRQDVQTRREKSGRATSIHEQRPPGRIDNRAPATTLTRPAAPPVTRDTHRGRDTQNALPASRSGYGGYGSNRDAATYRERGRSSQENMRQTSRPAPIKREAPVQRPVPAQRPAPAQRPSFSGDKQPAPRPAAQPERRQPRPAGDETGRRQQH